MIGRAQTLIIVVLVVAALPAAAAEPVEHPLEPPDRSSPRATISTFLDSIDIAWDIYSSGGVGYVEPFLKARQCLDTSEIPPLVFREASGKAAVTLKDVLDRIELPPRNEIPDASAVAELGLSTWAVPHTEIMLELMTEGDQRGQWLFTKGTVARTDEFYERVRHLPLRPGRLGGHVEELRTGTQAMLLLKMVEIGPSWFKREVGGMFFWQWFGLGLLVTLIVLGFAIVAWISKKWALSGLPGHRLSPLLVPLALMGAPIFARVMIARIFALPGAPALVLRGVFAVIGYAGLMWFVALLLTRLGELVVALWFRRARPLKKQLVRVIFRIATIVVVTGIAITAAQSLGVPVAGLIAGVGVGGLAIALAAQSTLENFIGGIILYADQPVRVGDICKFGNRRGTVEDVGLRSTKIRTIDKTLVTVPNADFAKMELENLSERDRVLLRDQIRLRYETTLDQLRQVMASIEAMLREHAEIDEEKLRVRLNEIGENGFEIELYCYALTGAWPEFTRIREDVLLKAMEIIESSGTRLALPTEIHYRAGDDASNQSEGSPQA
jgi:MscS family membrane protein